MAEHESFLLDDTLILSPHDKDTFLLSPRSSIPLKAKNDATWFVDRKRLGEGKTMDFSPLTSGTYEIEARAEEKREIITITVQDTER